MHWRNPVRLHMTVMLALCLAGTVVSWWYLGGQQHSWMRWLACWLLAVNVVTFGYYAFDKLQARRSGTSGRRVPEIALHALGVLGGSPAALLAMHIFRHKTIKRSFRILFWSIVVLQIALTAYIVKRTWWE